ncbi:MAG: type II secretion system protein [Bacilli bacterium]|nr:type II secretion system protein [Bacilli bacterium]
MKNKRGFTLIEILAVFSVLAIIMLLAIPAYGLIRGNVNKKMYENKVSLIRVAADNWAGETGMLVTNVEHLINEGKLEADNEAGDFVNPIDGTSLLCRILRIKKDDNFYISELTSEENCDYDSLLRI